MSRPKISLQNASCEDPGRTENSGPISGSTIKYDPSSFSLASDKASFVPYVTLIHEMWHVVDMYAFYNGKNNPFFPWNKNDSAYSIHKFGENGTFPFTYIETRAVIVENAMRSQHGMSLRKWYGGKYIYDVIETFWNP